MLGEHLTITKGVHPPWSWLEMRAASQREAARKPREGPRVLSDPVSELLLSAAVIIPVPCQFQAEMHLIVNAIQGRRAELEVCGLRTSRSLRT